MLNLRDLIFLFLTTDMPPLFVRILQFEEERMRSFRASMRTFFRIVMLWTMVVAPMTAVWAGDLMLE